MDAVPHGLDPLSAQHPEHDHERVEEILEVPQRDLPGEPLVDVLHAEERHPDDGEDEDDDREDEAEVAEGAHRAPDDADEEVEGGPGLGQLEHSQL